MTNARYRRAACAAALLLLLPAGSPLAPVTEAVSPDLVISQVYGAGGNSGAVYTHDYVELYNRGAAPVSLGGLSIQYASATGTGNFGASTTQLTELPNVSVPPGGYFLVQQSGGANGVPLPPPDFIDPTPISMAAGAGKLALVSGTASLGCNGGSTPCPAAALARIIDLVGYGNANFFEGSGPAPALGAALAAFRAGGGAIDTDDNAVDFMAAAPNPRTGSAVVRLTIADVSVPEGDTGTSLATFTVTLSAPAGLNGVAFTVSTQDGTATAADLDYVPMSESGFIGEGATSQSFDVTINGDLTQEPDEFFFVTVTDVTGDVEVADGQAVGTIRNDDVEAVPIHAIQGSGSRSPLENQVVATTGIVTGRKSNGFFLQTPDAEADDSSATSEGIFVFTGSAPSMVAAGDAVRVTGRVVEFRSASAALPGTLTELSGPLTVTVLSRGNPLPAPVDASAFDVTAPSREAQFERYESMLVHAASVDVVSPTNRFGEFFVVLSGVARPFREPGIEVSDVLPGDAPAGIARFDGNYEAFMVETDESLLADGSRRPTLQLATGAMLTPVLGPLDYAFDAYRVSLDAELAVAVTPGVTPQPAAAGAAHELTVSSLNVLNFFPPNANNPAQVEAFEARLAHAAQTIVDGLRTPDILGLIEMGDIAVLRQLRDRVNLTSGASYEAYLVEADGDDGNDQDVGYLVNLARIDVLRDPFPVHQGETFTLCGITDIVFDRPPFVLEARFQGMPVTVILNHLRSLIDINSMAPFGPAGCPETLGSRVREKRRIGAELLADVIEARQHENLVVIGDMNAFEFNDGYVDVIGTLEGSPAPADQVVEPSADRWMHALTTLARMVPRDQRYSYVFQGSAQVLDHILVNDRMASRLTRFAFARVNADFPESERLSDHDAPVAYFAPRADLVTTTNLPATVDAGSAFTYELTVANAGEDPAQQVTLTATLPAGTAFGSIAAPADWNCAAFDGQVICQAATLDAGGEASFTIGMTVDCALADGTALRASTTATSATMEANPADNASADAAGVSNPPPRIDNPSVDTAILWPPNHTMRDVRVLYDAADTCGPVTAMLHVSSNEAVNGLGDGDTAPDWEVVNDHHVRLRAERSGTGAGRVYTITVTATDVGGHRSSREVTVTVPHDR